MDLNWVFLDLETTGFDAKIDKIIEIAAVSVTCEGSKETFNSVVDPGIPIPVHITRLTGIDDNTVKGALSFQELRSSLLRFIGDKIIVAHNAGFDISFLEGALGHSLPNTCLDTVEFARLVYVNLTSYSLRHLAREFAIDSCPSHRALADVLALEGLFNVLTEKVRSLPVLVIQQIHDIIKQSNHGLAILFEEILKEKIRQYDFTQDLRNAKKARPAEESFCQDKPAEMQWDIALLEKMFLPGGCVANGLQTYQKRSEQIKMAKAVAKAMSGKRHLLVEAGTGVGKSMAYLVPAIIWAVTQHEKVVVATHTIALQEQLFHSEIQLLRKNLNVSFKATVLKGRNNYLCLEKYESAKEHAAAMNWTEKLLMARIAVWLALDGSGDKDSLNLREREAELYSQLSSTVESCWGAQCQYYDECFYQKAKQKAQEADLIIVNHSLLLADLKLGGAVLPKYQFLIIDEAHHLEDEGAKHFSETFSLREFQLKLSQVQKRSDIFKKSGLLNFWKQYLLANDKSNPSTREMLEKIREAEACLTSVKNTCNEISSYLARNPTIETARIHEKTWQQSWWRDTSLLFDNLLLQTSDFLSLLDKLHDYLMNDNDCEDSDPGLKELRVFISKIKMDYELVKKFFTQERVENEVFWLERENYNNDLRLHITPLMIANIFHDYLFSSKESIVLTSATLSVEENFSFLIEQLGIPEELVDTARIPSPFFYDEQSLLLIDNSLPDPVRTSEEGFGMAVAEALTVLLKVMNGNTLVLFTSHKLMRYVFDLLCETLRQAGLELFADGINGRRNTLIGELKNNSNAIVFGAGTYWEGIDLPGQSLTSLVIVKLPFLPPNMPLIEAKTEELVKNGKNGFFHLSLPQAVLKFRQGYGRLIRTMDDCGIVVVMDNRLIAKRYGKSFLHSLPDQHYFAGDTRKIADKIEDWFKLMKINENKSKN